MSQGERGIEKCQIVSRIILKQNVANLLQISGVNLHFGFCAITPVHLRSQLLKGCHAIALRGG